MSQTWDAQPRAPGYRGQIGRGAGRGKGEISGGPRSFKKKKRRAALKADDTKTRTVPAQAYFPRSRKFENWSFEAGTKNASDKLACTSSTRHIATSALLML